MLHSEADSGSDSAYLQSYCLLFFHGRGRVSPDSDWHCVTHLLIFLCCTLEEIQRKSLVSVGSGGYQVPLCESLSALVTMLTPQKLKHEEGGGFYILLYLFKLTRLALCAPSHRFLTSVGLCLLFSHSASLGWYQLLSLFPLL